MKKLLSILLAIATMLTLFASCDGTSEKKDSDKDHNSFGYEDNANTDYYEEEEIDINSSVSVGDYITFGKYEQDNNISNGQEEIEWLVLEREGDRVFVVSRYALDCQRYNDVPGYVTWETCPLRAWLNDDFYNTAFSEAEKSMIPTVTVTVDNNPNSEYHSCNVNKDYSASPGNNTQDKIFLLSIDEANEYFVSYTDKTCEPTAYAKAQGARVNDSYNYCWWWLRTLCLCQAGAAYYIKTTHGESECVNISCIAVRPVMWIEL